MFQAMGQQALERVWRPGLLRLVMVGRLASPGLGVGKDEQPISTTQTIACMDAWRDAGRLALRAEVCTDADPWRDERRIVFWWMLLMFGARKAQSREDSSQAFRNTERNSIIHRRVRYAPSVTAMNKTRVNHPSHNAVKDRAADLSL